MLVTDKKLDTWVGAGLLSADQAAAIRSWEQSQHSGRSWVIYGITVIGIAAIAIGVISIVASNWDRIPAYTKLAIYLCIQTGLGAALYRQLPKTGKIRESLLSLFCLFFFAGIGLTAQVFNISSNGWSGLLFWCGLTVSAVALAGTRQMPYLWFVVLLIAESIWMLGDRGNFNPDLNALKNRLTFAWLSIYMFFGAGILIPAVVRTGGYLAEAARNLSFLILFVGGTVGGTALWYVDFNKVAREMPLSFIDNAKIIPWVGLLLTIPPMLLYAGRETKKVAKALSVAFVLLAAFTTIPVIFELRAHPTAGTIISIVIWWSLAVAAVYAGRKRIFDFITLAITVRLLVVYFEVFGSMMATGIGLIISGLLILGIAWVWYKFRDRLAAMVEKT